MVFKFNANQKSIGVNVACLILFNRPFVPKGLLVHYLLAFCPTFSLGKLFLPGLELERFFPAYAFLRN